MGSASGFEIGCQGYCFGVANCAAGCSGLLAAGTVCGMDSSKATSSASGSGTGSFSTSKAASGSSGKTNGNFCVGEDADKCGSSADTLEGAVDDAAAGLADSAFRSRPRATRSVPFDCSTLMGLVRTRLAPMRNALATPACPSTSATERALAFEPELRALLKNKLAFCSFSQSTTIASKCCAISFLTAANGSLQHST